MCGYFPKKFNPTILHRHRLIQSLGYRFGNQGFFVLLQKSNLFFQICGNAVNLGTFFIKEICDSLLFFNIWKSKPKLSQLASTDSRHCCTTGNHIGVFSISISIHPIHNKLFIIVGIWTQNNIINSHNITGFSIRNNARSSNRLIKP